MADPWIRGESIPGVRFAYNVLVEIIDGPARGARGWTVGLDPSLDEPVYLIEREDRERDIEVPQSHLRIAPPAPTSAA